MLSSASDKAKSSTKNFSKNSDLDDSGTSLSVYPSKTNLKLPRYYYFDINISATPKMIRKVIINLGLQKGSGPDCILVVVLKNCKLEHSYILAETSKILLF